MRRLAPALLAATLVGLAACAQPQIPSLAGPASKPLPPGPAESRGGGAPAPPARVPILMYHYIRVNPNPADQIGAGLSVTPDDFRSQMDWLRDGGWHPVYMSQLRAHFERGETLPDKPVVITFDDGYADLYSAALPVLLSHGFRAEAYIVPGFLGRPGYLTVDQLKSLEAEGVEVGAHTMTHPDLTTIHGDRLRDEVAGSGKALADLVGHPVVDFCYPSGRYDQEVVDEVQRDGFQTAVTTEPGPPASWADRYSWGRVRVSGGESLPDFARAVQG